MAYHLVMLLSGYTNGVSQIVILYFLMLLKIKDLLVHFASPSWDDWIHYSHI